MVKYICDVCKKEFDSKLNKRDFPFPGIYTSDLTNWGTKDICDICDNKLINAVKQLKYDFIISKGELNV